MLASSADSGARVESPTILLPELAALLGRPGDAGERYVMRWHRKLTAEQGFPARLPTGWAWPRRLVEIWIDNFPIAGGTSQLHGGPRGRGNPAPPANDDIAPDAAALVAAQRENLTRRYVEGR